MSNPTLGAGQQFTKPYDILPNIIYTNPTAQNNSQFLDNYNISTNQEFLISQNILGYQNPTEFSGQQFTTVLPPNPYPLTNTNPFTVTTTINYTTYIPKEAPNNSKYSLALLNVPVNVTGGFTNLDNTRALNEGIGFAAGIAAGALGFPQVAQSAQSIYNFHSGDFTGRYFTLPFDQLTNKINTDSVINIVNSIGSLSPYSDFRSKKFASSFKNQNANALAKISTFPANARKDGASSAFRDSFFKSRSALYAGATLSPAGAYTLFNLNGIGELGYGWGDHDANHAIRSDFTLRSEVATTWRFTKPKSLTAPEQPGKFYKSTNKIESITPFRGDKVTVIDFGQRLLKNAYQWKPSSQDTDKIPKTSKTKDFIKFFLTGPKLTNNSTVSDDIIVFRAILTSLTDTFSPSWTDVKMIGRADPNYHYNGYARSLNLGFDIVITDRDELKPTWRKLNALAGYTAPIYDKKTIALTAPWMRITLGDLFHQTPVVITSLGYTYDLDHSWEINIEGDNEMFETPRKISVSCDLNVISDYLPQQGGRFFNLAKRYDGGTNMPIEGDDNWLSDFNSTAPDPNIRQSEVSLQGNEKEKKQRFWQRSKKE